MAYVVAPGGGIYLPSFAAAPSLGNSGNTMNATNTRFAMIGQVRWKDNAATKDIRRVQFKWGTVVKAGGSALTISLQDVSLTAGPAFRPDDTQDQTVAVANADASFVSDTWYRTGTFSADRTAAHGSLLAVVIEFDGSGRLGADTVQIIVDTQFAGTQTSGILMRTSGGSWPSVALSSIANVLLEASDGTLGTLDFSHALSTTANETGYNSGSTPDETGNAFTLPFDCKVDAVWVQMLAGSSADFDVCLYRGTTLIASVSVDYNTVFQLSTSKLCLVTFTDVEIQKNVEHFWTVKPTTANSVTLYGMTVNDATHWDVHPGGQAMCYASRTDAGSFSKTTTKRIFGGIRISQVVDGTANITNIVGVIGS